MTDLTKITTAFGLLDEVYGPGTQEALRAHGGPVQYYSEGCWFDTESPYWVLSTIYRVKPQPPKLREGWCYLTHMFATEEAATDFRAKVAADHGEGHLQNPITHWREVLPE